MDSLSLGEVLPVVRELARQKARTVIGICGLTAGDREDIESELLVDFCTRFPKFDSRRSSIRTFASSVMQKKLASILRYRLAGRRRYALTSGKLEMLDECHDQIVPGNGPSHIQRQEFWTDLDRLLVPFPDGLRETAFALCWASPSELSRMLGQSRTTIYGRIRRLREAFAGAGIGPAYFASFGGGR